METSADPVIRIKRGNPDAEELAALVAVLQIRAATAEGLRQARQARQARPVRRDRPSVRWRALDGGSGFRAAHSWQAVPF